MIYINALKVLAVSFAIVSSAADATKLQDSQVGQDVLIHYPLTVEGGDAHTLIVETMIELALKNQQTPWSLEFLHLPMERVRQEAELAKGKFINVLMLPGSNTYDERFLLVPIPIDRGLIGLRLSFVRASERDQLKSVTNKNDLQTSVVCADKNWSVTKVFQENEIPVFKTNQYRQNFAALIRDKCDHFSRGVIEIEEEFELFSENYPDMVIDQHIALQIPMAFYLYVSPQYPKVHKALIDGLTAAVESGEFIRVFNEIYDVKIQRLGMASRIIIPLKVEVEHDNGADFNGPLWYR